MDKMKPIKALVAYFGYRAEEHRKINPDTGERLTGIQDFGAEVKALSPEEKQELSEGAAAALGVELDLS